ncbi:MAG: anti-sigma factor family protein [Persicimonas sp.]
MNCHEFQLFSDAYVDGEFGDREGAEIEAHLRECSECRAELDKKLRFKEQFKEVLGQEKAPEALRERIVAGLDEVDRESRRSAGDNPVVRYAAIGGSLAASVAMIVFFLPNLTVVEATGEQVPVVENTIDWHRGDFPIEVPGPETHEVARWFHGKVDFPVRLPQFKNEDVRLVGGRIAHVKERRAAYALYEIDGSRLSVMIFHGDDFKVPGDKIRKVGNRDIAVLESHGYEVAVLQDAGITYTMTSDLAEDELLDLVGASLSRERAPRRLAQ